MSITLPPTVHERLARCGERVYVDRIKSGATVELHIDGAVFTAVVAGGSHTFNVPPLNAGAVVRARQDDGTGFTPFSPSVIVENAFVPPEAAPSVPEVVGNCSQCVLVNHATPGARLEVRIGNQLIGEGIANNHGGACVGIDLRRLDGEREATLLARQVVCGVPGPNTARLLSTLPPLPKPTISGTVFGCQNVVPVSGARPGARLTFETDGGDNLGSLCSCWSAVNVGVIRALAVGERVRTRCYYDAKPCDEMGPWSDWEPVVQPDERIKPEVLEALIEGDQIIRVANQIGGASLMIHIAPAEGQAPEEFGPVPTSDELEIGLIEPLEAGNVVSVVQTLCGVSVESDPVIVRPRPPEIFAPVIVPPLYACGRAIQVSNLHPGAQVRVFADGVEIGLGWSGIQNSITILVPALTAGREVTAIQWLGGTPSPASDAVKVVEIEELHKPRVLGPVALGDRSVWVSGVTPGARVAILSSGLFVNPVVIGETYAAEPVVEVPVGPFLPAALISAIPKVSLCERTATGDSHGLVRSPCGKLSSREISESTIDLGSFHVPAVADGGDFDFQIRGQLYAPADINRARMPLVIIAHGWHTGVNQFTGDKVDSFMGYGYLARHLVSWGMLVFSVDLQEVNDRSIAPAAPQQFARAEVILEAINRLQGFNLVEDVIWADRIGLVGHSMAGEAVALAQFLNLSENRGFGIRGVVSIAPTRWHPQVVLPEGRYMQLFGSLDQLTGFIPAADTPSAAGGMRIYDRAERDKTLFWIYGLRHNPFNSLWVPAGDYAEAHFADLALPEGEHERVARCLINAFFQDKLLNRDEYRGYMEGTVFPQSLRHLAIHTSHSRQPRDVLDNFGDADDQAALIAEMPLVRAMNSQGEAANAAGAGLGDWEDTQHSTIANSPHSTAGTRLSWKAPQVEYTSDTGGIGGALEDVIGLRLAQFFEDNDLNPVALPSDLFVALSDGAAEAVVRLGAVAQIPYPDAAQTVLSMMRTVRLPLDAFKAANPALDLGAIRSVALRFTARPTGHILGDDFEFSP